MRWQRWRELTRTWTAYASRRPREPAVVVLEPRGGRLSWSSPFPQVVRQLSDLGAVAS